MNEQIKQRITQLNNGEVPTGYKKTDLGIFPCEWIEYSIGEVSIDKGKYGINAPACEYKEGLPRYLRITDIDDDGCYIDNSAYVDHANSNEYVLNENDLVFARTGASVGKSYLYKKQDGLLVYAGFLIKFSIDPNKCNAYIVKKNCVSTKFEEWVQIMSARSGQPGINAEEYAEYRFVAPKSSIEQSRIAEILMKWDEAIQLKEQYIEKLKERKKSILDFLLTPQNHWKPVKVKDIFKITRGQVLPTNQCSDSGKYPVYSSQTADNGLMGYYDEYLFENCITWTTDGANAGDVNFRKGKFYCTNVCGVLISDQGYANLCVAHIIGKVAKNYVSYIGNPKLMNNTMGIITIKLPSMNEQENISSIIEDLNCEIQLQNEEKSCLIAQRKTLQQYLLNGIVRV